MKRTQQLQTKTGKPICICDGRKHFVGKKPLRYLRTLHKTNPYCKAHAEQF